MVNWKKRATYTYNLTIQIIYDENCKWTKFNILYLSKTVSFHTFTPQLIHSIRTSYALNVLNLMLK